MSRDFGGKFNIIRSILFFLNFLFPQSVLQILELNEFSMTSPQRNDHIISFIPTFEQYRHIRELRKKQRQEQRRIVQQQQQEQQLDQSQQSEPLLGDCTENIRENGEVLSSLSLSSTTSRSDSSTHLRTTKDDAVVEKSERLSTAIVNESCPIGTLTLGNDDDDDDEDTVVPELFDGKDGCQEQVTTKQQLLLQHEKRLVTTTATTSSNDAKSITRFPSSKINNDKFTNVNTSNVREREEKDASTSGVATATSGRHPPSNTIKAKTITNNPYKRTSITRTNTKRRRSRPATHTPGQWIRSYHASTSCSPERNQVPTPSNMGKHDNGIDTCMDEEKPIPTTPKKTILTTSNVANTPDSHGTLTPSPQKKINKTSGTSSVWDSPPNDDDDKDQQSRKRPWFQWKNKPNNNSNNIKQGRHRRRKLQQQSITCFAALPKS